MSDPSAAGAAAAASYFFALYPYVFASGDLAEWSALSSDTCEYCQNVRKSVEDQTARGVVGSGAEVTVESAEGIEVTPGETYAADLVVTQAPSFEMTRDGERVPDGDGGRFQIHVALGWESGWVVRAIDAARA